MTELAKLAALDCETLIRDLYPGLEQAMQEQDRACEGEITLTIKFSGNENLMKMVVTGKAKDPKMTRESRKVQWIDGQLEMFVGSDPETS